MKVSGPTGGLHWELPGLSSGGGAGIPGVGVKSVEIGRTPVAKAGSWPDTDAEARKRGERTGLDTLVVHAVNDVH